MGIKVAKLKNHLEISFSLGSIFPFIIPETPIFPFIIPETPYCIIREKHVPHRELNSIRYQIWHEFFLDNLVQYNFAHLIYYIFLLKLGQRGLNEWRQSISNKRNEFLTKEMKLGRLRIRIEILERRKV